MPYFSNRLPHVLTRADLALLIAPTYAEQIEVEDDEAHERLVNALGRPGVADELYDSLSTALSAAQTPSMTADGLMDKLSKGVGKRRGRIKPAPATTAMAAVMVWINLAIELAPESMRATLSSDKGRALLVEGRRALGSHLVKELLR